MENTNNDKPDEDIMDFDLLDAIYEIDGKQNIVEYGYWPIDV